MPRFADATNSFKQWMVGGETQTPWRINSGGSSLASQRLQIGDNHGDTKDESLLNLIVGSEGSPLSVGDYLLGVNNNASTVVSDKDISVSNKFLFKESYNVVPYRFGVDNGKIRMQYHESHLIGQNSYDPSEDITTCFFTMGISSGGSFPKIPDSSIFAFRILLSFCGIKRIDSFDDESFSGYIDVSGGIANLNNISNSNTGINFIIDQINNQNYLDDVSRFWYINTGTQPLSYTPVFKIETSSDDMIISIVLPTQYRISGSAKLTLVENGLYQTDIDVIELTQVFSEDFISKEITEL